MTLCLTKNRAKQTKFKINNFTIYKVAFQLFNGKNLAPWWDSNPDLLLLRRM
jgi:hypothetical protein